MLIRGCKDQWSDRVKVTMSLSRQVQELKRLRLSVDVSDLELIPVKRGNQHGTLETFVVRKKGGTVNVGTRT